MTAHPDTHTPEAAHEHGHESADPKLDIAASLKFEPIEIQDFELADKAAGQMMGKLLGFLFCVLLTLMTGVNLWMVGRDATGADPQNLTAPVGGLTDPVHKAPSEHHQEHHEEHH